jgi:hypothetical protein
MMLRYETMDEKQADLGTWNKIRLETRLGKKCSSRQGNIFPKKTGLSIWNRFGMDLAIPNI